MFVGSEPEMNPALEDERELFRAVRHRMLAAATAGREGDEEGIEPSLGAVPAQRLELGVGPGTRNRLAIGAAQDETTFSRADRGEE